MATEKDCQKAFAKCKVVLLDVAGTISSIKFIQETLFAYITENIEGFVKENWETEDIKNALKTLNDDKDVADVDAAAQLVKDAIAKQSTNIGLKTLSGYVFAKGYENGTLIAHVYVDVPLALSTWSKNYKIAIYSTGSVNSQKLLIKHSVEGDLSSNISHYFDQTVGEKTVVESYLKIVKELDVSAEEVLWISDSKEELKAGKAAGLATVLITRETEDDTDTEFFKVKSFSELVVGVNKRKNEDDGVANPQDEPPAKIIKKDDSTDIKQNGHHTDPTDCQQESVSSTESQNEMKVKDNDLSEAVKEAHEAEPIKTELGEKEKSEDTVAMEIDVTENDAQSSEAKTSSNSEKNESLPEKMETEEATNSILEKTEVCVVDSTYNELEGKKTNEEKQGSNENAEASKVDKTDAATTSSEKVEEITGNTAVTCDVTKEVLQETMEATTVENEVVDDSQLKNKEPLINGDKESVQCEAKLDEVDTPKKDSALVVTSTEMSITHTNETSIAENKEASDKVSVVVSETSVTSEEKLSKPIEVSSDTVETSALDGGSQEQPVIEKPSEKLEESDQCTDVKVTEATPVEVTKKETGEEVTSSEEPVQNSKELNGTINGNDFKLNKTTSETDCKVDEEANVTDRKVDETANGTNCKVDETTNGTDCKVDEATNGTNCKVDETTNGKDSKVDETTNGTNSKVDETTNGTNSKVDETTNGTNSKVDETTNGTNSKVDETTNGTDSKVDETTTGDENDSKNPDVGLPDEVKIKKIDTSAEATAVSIEA